MITKLTKLLSMEELKYTHFQSYQSTKNSTSKSWIRIPYEMDLNPYSKMSSECLKKDQIWIPVFWIWILIPKSFFRSEIVKFGLWIWIPKGWIRIPIVKFQKEAVICIPKKKAIVFQVLNMFWFGLFLKKKSEDKVKNLLR